MTTPAPFPPSEQAPATPTPFTKEQVNYLLHVIDFNKPHLQALIDSIAPFDLTVILAYLQAAVESQVPAAGEAFNELRELFNHIYPALLKADSVAHPDAPPAPDQLLIVFPAPSIGVAAISPDSSNPQIIQPGSNKVN